MKINKITKVIILISICFVLLSCGQVKANDFYNATGIPTDNSLAVASTFRAEFSAIEDGFDTVSPLTGNGSEFVTINSGATAQESVAASAVRALIGAAGLITTDTTFYLTTAGNDTTGDGSSGSPWYSLAKVFDYLKDKWIATDALVTIDSDDGTYTGLAQVIISHPCANRIEISGTSQSGTIRVYTDNGIIVQGTNLRLLEKITLKGSSSTANYGLYVRDQGSVYIENIGLSIWGFALYIFNNSSVYLNAGTDLDIDTSKYGIQVTNNCFLNAQLATVDCSSIASSRGITVNQNSAARFDYSTVSNTVTGFFASGDSFISALSTTCTNCTGDDYDPNVTTGDTPTFDNVGSWIYKP